MGAYLEGVGKFVIVHRGVRDQQSGIHQLSVASCQELFLFDPWKLST